MKNNESKILAGKLLISAPHLSDFFTRSVILMMEYNENGSLGFVVNKPVEEKLHEIIQDFPEFDAKIMLGGPVETDLINFIHRAGEILDGGVEIGNGIYWGGNFETLKILAEAKKLNPDDFIFFLGYSGWSGGQLDEELNSNTWIITKTDIDIIFDVKAIDKWSIALKRMGGDYTTISSFPIDPSVN